MNLLPAPFPIEELLSERTSATSSGSTRSGGLSYGNLSARNDESRFWMSASGVNKAELRTPGEHILMVKGYDPEQQRHETQRPAPRAAPPRFGGRHRALDDLHRAPKVGAIVHIHAWMEGIPSTEVNYPCGPSSWPRRWRNWSVSAEEPERAVIGLKNHGLTITGHRPGRIFERIDGKIIRQVPMS